MRQWKSTIRVLIGVMVMAFILAGSPVRADQPCEGILCGVGGNRHAVLPALGLKAAQWGMDLAKRATDAIYNSIWDDDYWYQARAATITA